MTINNQNIVRSVGEYLESKTNYNTVKNIHSLQKESEYNLLLKNLTDDEKFRLVSEKIDKENNIELRFHENTPIAKPLESQNIFNETKKVAVQKERKKFSTFNYRNEEHQKIIESKNEKGFYIIIDGMIFQPQQDHKELSFMQKRINEIYNIKYTRDPGTLVNVVA